MRFLSRQAELDIAAKVAADAQADATFWKAQARRSDTEANLATLREVAADCRAREWEAIAMELINRGAGRPRPDAVTKKADPIAERIRDESGGDAKVAAHFWTYVAELRKQKKTDDEIVGMIGWTSEDPTEATAP
jgi:hypothetical protein